MIPANRAPRHLITLLGVFLAVLACMAAVNYRVDPASIFLSAPLEEQIAQQLIAGRSVAIFGNLNERQLQRQRLKGEVQRGKSIDTLVLGSSRALLIGEWLTARPTINASVTGATLEDLIAVYAMARPLAPRQVILNIDPWVFNRNHNQQTWRLLSREYGEGLLLLGLPVEGAAGMARNPLRDWLQLINLDYFRESIKTWRKGRVDVRFASDAPDPLPAGAMRIRPDASRAVLGISGDRQARARAIEESLAATSVGPRFFGLNDYVAVDEAYWKKFEALAGHLSRHAQVTLLLMPFHPDAWQRLGSIAAILESEARLRAWAASRSIRLIGSYAPQTAPCGRGDFADHIHPNELCLEKTWPKAPDSAKR